MNRIKKKSNINNTGDTQNSDQRIVLAKIRQDVIRNKQKSKIRKNELIKAETINF